ncbi:MAG: hypothetical protein HC824_03960 [Synechococcales cyanobacterium RM1_1_8]|nr:hypothetical protein [Synechococcales cyanobacterium RM1_1_8]
MLLTELSAPAPAICKLLMERRQYRTCHIRVPDLEQHLSAIQTGEGEFYSFYRVFPESAKLLTVVAKLGNRGDRMAITPSPKGYTLWVHEPDASALSSPGLARKAQLAQEAVADVRFLSAQAIYYPCMIELPSGRKYLSLAIDGGFYRFFKLEQDFGRVVNVAGRLSRQGSEVLIATAQGVLEKVVQHLDPKTLQGIEDGYVICLFEPDARLAVLD